MGKKEAKLSFSIVTSGLRDKGAITYRPSNCQIITIEKKGTRVHAHENMAKKWQTPTYQFTRKLVIRASLLFSLSLSSLSLYIYI